MLPLNQIYNGDCLNLLNFIDNNSVDMILTDLPYGKTRNKWDIQINLEKLWSQYLRIIKKNAPILFFAQQPYSSILWNSQSKLYRYNWIWEKTNATGFLNAKKMPLVAHEEIMVFYKKLPTYNPQITEGHIKKTTKRKGINSSNYNKNKEVSYYNSTSRYPRSVLKFSSDKQKCNIHPTQKPLKLCEYFVKTYTNEKNLIIDSCAGSGTIGIACEKLNRNYILMEKELYYCEKYCERLTEYYKNKTKGSNEVIR